MTMPTSVMDMLHSLQEPGKRLVDAGELYEAFSLIFGAQSGIAAAGVAPGPVLTQAINQVVSGTFVLLPSAIAGLRITVVNSTGSILAISASRSNPANGGAADLINGSPSDVQQSGAIAQYLCYALGQWMQLAAGSAADEPGC